MMDIAGKRVVIVGLGASGVSAAELCSRLGASVVGVDKRPRAQLGAAARALPLEIELEAAADRVLAGADLIVISPGVEDFPALVRAEAAGVAVIGELALGARLCSAPICAIGGTNGKSTTTELVAAMLARAGKRVFCGGNLGTPLTRAVGGAWDCLVVEVSSFQLERAPDLAPRVSVLLNITDDHLDRHGSFEAYARAKGNAFANQTAGDVAIAPHGDAVVERQVRRGSARVVYFGDRGDYVLGERSREPEAAIIEVRSGQRYSLAGTALMARHNQLNAAAAVAAARAFDAEPAAIQAALEGYRTLPHRMAWVRDIGGVAFYDDSKATNVGAALAALDSVPGERVVLIAGGKDKQGSYQPLADALSRRGRAAVLIGEAAPIMANALGSSVPVERAATLAEAVASAYRLAQRGDAVLLAPACASFDMFRSYAERGERFVAAVEGLADREAARAAAGGGA